MKYASQLTLPSACILDNMFKDAERNCLDVYELINLLNLAIELDLTMRIHSIKECIRETFPAYYREHIQTVKAARDLSDDEQPEPIKKPETTPDPETIREEAEWPLIEDSMSLDEMADINQSHTDRLITSKNEMFEALAGLSRPKKLIYPATMAIADLKIKQAEGFRNALRFGRTA